LEKNLIIDFVGEIADKDVEVVGGIFLVGGVGLVSPVDADFLYIKSEICGGPKVNCKSCTYRLVNTSAVQGLHGSFSCSRIVVFNKTVIKSLRLKLDRD
jgi:hypothetical protein